MYQSNKAFRMLEELAGTHGTKDKEALLKLFWDADLNECFKYCVKACLDPFITFGLQKMPTIKLHGDGQFNEGTYTMLAAMQERTLTGNKAKAAVLDEMTRLTVESVDLLKVVITGKIGAKFSANTLNKVSPGEIYIFKTQLAEKFLDNLDLITDDMWAAGVSGEIKEDGVRGMGVEHKDYHFISRNGLPLTSNQALRDETALMLQLWAERAYDGFQNINLKYYLDCEMVETSDCFNETVGNVHKKDESSTKNMMLKVIDVLDSNEVDVNKRSNEGYECRRVILEMFFRELGHKFPHIELIEKFVFFSEKEVLAKFKELNTKDKDGKKKEGLMIKLPDGLWEPKRTTGWLKVKGKIEVDLTVKRLELGNPNGAFHSIMGGAICDYINSKGDTVEVTIGGGWTLAQRAEHWAVFSGKTTTYETISDGVTTVHEAHPDNGLPLVGQVIAVTAHEETKDGSLRHPNYDRMRHDKSPEDGQGC